MDKIQRQASHFTLIELLVVVALTGMLMGLGIPAFVRMIRGSKVDECARSIKLGLEQAQMRAASERCYAAVIFPNGSVSSSLNSYRLGGFRTAYVKDDDYSFIRWLDTEWRNRPDGAMLVRVDTSAPSVGSDLTDCTSGVDKALAGANKDNSLQQVSGVKDDNGNDINVGANTAVIFKPYGDTVNNSKLYLIVSEASADGDEVKYPTPNTNYKVLRVNNLTGRVEFYE